MFEEQIFVFSILGIVTVLAVLEIIPSEYFGVPLWVFTGSFFISGILYGIFNYLERS